MQLPDNRKGFAYLFSNLVHLNRNTQAKQGDKVAADGDMVNSKRNSIFSASTEASNENEIPFHFETFNDLPPSDSEASTPESRKDLEEGAFDFLSCQDSTLIAPQTKSKDNKQWGEEEDELLKKLGIVYKNDWKKIVKRFKVLRNIKKSPVFLMKRFKELNGNQPDTRRHFIHQEDLLIAECMEKFGTNWIEIAKHVSDRGPITIKNRYYSYIKKNNLLEKLISEAKSLREKENPVATSELQVAGPSEINIEEANFIQYAQMPAFEVFNWNEYQSFDRDFFGSSLENDFDACLRYF